MVTIAKGMETEEVIKELLTRSGLFSAKSMDKELSKDEINEVFGTPAIAKSMLKGLLNFTDGDSLKRYIQRQVLENPDTFVDKRSMWSRIRRMFRRSHDRR